MAIYEMFQSSAQGHYIICTNAALFLIRTLGTNFIEF